MLPRASSVLDSMLGVMHTEMNEILSPISCSSPSSNNKIMRSVVVVGSSEEMVSAGYHDVMGDLSLFSFFQQIYVSSGPQILGLTQIWASQDTASTWAPCWLKAVSTATVSRENCLY